MLRSGKKFYKNEKIYLNLSVEAYLILKLKFNSKANILEEVLTQLSSNKGGKFFKCEQLMSLIAYVLNTCMKKVWYTIKLFMVEFVTAFLMKMIFNIFITWKPPLIIVMPNLLLLIRLLIFFS